VGFAVRRFAAAEWVVAVHTALAAVLAFHTKAVVASALVLAYCMLAALADRMIAAAAFLHSLAFEEVSVVDPHFAAAVP